MKCHFKFDGSILHSLSIGGILFILDLAYICDEKESMLL